MNRLTVMPFKTRQGNNYILDTNTGTVIPVNNILMEVIELYHKESQEKIKEILGEKYQAEYIDSAMKFVERWSKIYNGFYREEDEKNFIEKNMKDFTIDDIRNFLSRGNTFQMVLNLTEDCNLRCKYCYLSEAYDYTRNRTSNRMTPEIGIKALDYFFEFLRPMAGRHPFKNIAVTFYGGEPFLNFSTFKTLVEYTNNNSPLQVIYNVTTNGLLLNEEIMDFIVANKIHVAISLDGARHNHDRNRILPNGGGSFDTVIKNISRFKERYPKYRNISVICVYDIKTDIESNIKFFGEQQLPNIVFLNAVSANNTDYYRQFTEEERSRFNEERERFLTEYIQKKIEGQKISDYLRVFFELGLASIILRPRHRDLPVTMIPFTGTCVPGVKISVRTDGTFDICERVNTTMPIGDVQNGLNYDNIAAIIKSYNKAVVKDCYYCPISKMCPMCFAQCMNDGAFELPENYCNITRKGIRDSFSDAYSILEFNKNAFKDMEGEFFNKAKLVFFY